MKWYTPSRTQPRLERSRAPSQSIHLLCSARISSVFWASTATPSHRTPNHIVGMRGTNQVWGKTHTLLDKVTSLQIWSDRLWNGTGTAGWCSLGNSVNDQNISICYTRGNIWTLMFSTPCDGAADVLMLKFVSHHLGSFYSSAQLTDNFISLCYRRKIQFSQHFL